LLFLIDLDGAFTLLDIYDGKEVVNFFTELRDGLVLFYLYLGGLFGWTGTPFCFQVSTRRACLWELRRIIIIVELVLMYVDDMFGNCRKRDLEANLRRAWTSSWGCLDPRLWRRPIKTQSGRRLVVIGCEFDLDEGLCGNLSARNLEKTSHISS